MKLITLLLVLVSASLTAVAGLEPTLNVVSRFTDRSLTSIVAMVAPSSTITLSVADHPDARWIEAEALRMMTEAGHSVVTSTAPTDVQIVIKDLSTQYEAHAESDSVDRVITVALEAIVTTNGTRRTATPPIERDRVACTRAEAKAAESRQHQATHGELPPAPSSMWDDIVEPVIFVTAAVATVVLLFTVRSK
jgi:hypothetical protein